MRVTCASDGALSPLSSTPQYKSARGGLPATLPHVGATPTTPALYGGAWRGGPRGLGVIVMRRLTTPTYYKWLSWLTTDLRRAGLGSADGGWAVDPKVQHLPLVQAWAAEVRQLKQKLALLDIRHGDVHEMNIVFEVPGERSRAFAAALVSRGRLLGYPVSAVRLTPFYDDCWAHRGRCQGARPCREPVDQAWTCRASAMLCVGRTWKDALSEAKAWVPPGHPSMSMLYLYDGQTSELLDETFRTWGPQSVGYGADAVELWGGEASMIAGWRTELYDRPTGNSAGTTDRYFYDTSGKKFRSRSEIARALGLSGAPAVRIKGEGMSGALARWTRTTLFSEAPLNERVREEAKSIFDVCADGRRLVQCGPEIEEKLRGVSSSLLDELYFPSELGSLLDP